MARADTWNVRGAQCDQGFNNVKGANQSEVSGVDSHLWETIRA